MNRYHWIIGCLLILTLIAGCASQAEKDYNLANRIDTKEAYLNFLEKHPDSDYTSIAKINISVIDEHEKIQKQKHQKTQEKEKSENDKKIKALEKYKVGVLTLEEFQNDGWNVSDPHKGLVGIVGFSRRGNKTLYLLGTKSTVDMSQYPPNIPHPGEIAEAMTKPIIESNEDGVIKLSSNAVVKYKIAFVDGVCIQIAKE